MNRIVHSPCVLTIAGSDSGSAAGIQADLKTFAAHGVHGLTAITAITAQNTRKVAAIHVLPQRFVAAQLDAVLADFPIAAVKIGMLGNAANTRLVAAWLRKHGLRNIVVDPVLIASSGRPLLPAGGLAVLRRELLALADVLTPNVPEAEALLARSIRSHADMREAAHDLLALGPRGILIKGGHLDTARIHDLFVDAGGSREFTHRKRPYAARGTGCTLASAIAAGLALGHSRSEATARAERYLQATYHRAGRYGHGPRILKHV
jgi:hydroxymethylpyrimidine/phosphomethylpyrimidine kinase